MDRHIGVALMSDDGFILECDLARHGLTVFDPPNYEPVCDGRYTIMLAEDGGLGACQRMNQQLKLWSREVSDSADARWVLRRLVYLENLLPVGALLDAETRVQVLGFAEGANAIFLTTAIRAGEEVVSFYTPVPRGEHRGLSLKHSEDAGGEEQEGGGGEKSNVTKGDFVNAFECINHAIENRLKLYAFIVRVPPYGEVAPACTSTLLLVWEPTTGAQQRVPVPVVYDVICRYEEVTVYATAAVFCAADGGCDHRDCFRGPFGVLLVFCVEHDGDGDGGRVTLTRLYSSETDSWDELRWIFHGLPMCFTFCSSVLVGRSLLYFMSDDGCILEYDFARHDLTVFDPPNYEPIYDGRYNIMLAEDGGLGVTQEMSPHLKLWTREVIEGADARWVLSRVIYLQNLLPDGALVEPASSLYVLGFAEGANVIFMTTVAGLFTVELESERVSRVCDDHVFCNLIPIVSFYTPVPRGEQKDPSFEPSEDGGWSGGRRG
ncbi:uncharacterized protein LOC125554897 [Triticum urartu]|uniref:uncharacterized protein LOC125554897 n=1 Tax=Triticum urartu TaxID=4572 RepID=UPI0020435F22|nr:uncharacterized protein LOC125554897 [Triticum urartu]